MCQKFCVFFLASLLFFTTSEATAYSTPLPHQDSKELRPHWQDIIKKPAKNVSAVPDYAKWGNIAMEETKNRYAQASIIDYLHVGRTEIAHGQSEEKFKLWLRRHDGSEFGVYVTIRFNTYTEKIQSIRFMETDRR